MSGEAKRLSAEDREICRHFIQQRAYYYGVGPVGCEPINILLGAVNRAGKMYHHTEGWTEPSSYATTGDGSCVDIIDAAAYEAAEYISRIERERDEAERALTRHGYRKSCDIPACNCGDQWNHGGHAAERLREISDVLHENGFTLLKSAERAVERIAALEAENARLRHWLNTSMTYYDVVTGDEKPLLQSVSKRIWYHATDDKESWPFAEVIDAARKP